MRMRQCGDAVPSRGSGFRRGHKIHLTMAGGGDGTEQQSFRLLGLRMLHAGSSACFRESVLSGAGGAAAAGLLHFLLTSRVKTSLHVGCAAFLVTTGGAWLWCKVNDSKMRFQQRRIQEGIRNKIIYEGTIVDPTNRGGSEPPPPPPPPRSLGAHDR
ncbi:cytochrome c oxidase assembly protein COX20, mitochondrial [Brachionichthys hirsutus]|uniref:cytochrome c oxidase assembly protein COX20, mitochondrial n=1 Tax=Brachionichthys hirsutus TaxID=412623 RepID=UPI003604850C